MNTERERERERGEGDRERRERERERKRGEGAVYHEFTYYYLQLEQACGLRSSSNWHWDVRTHTPHATCHKKINDRWTVRVGAAEQTARQTVSCVWQWAGQKGLRHPNLSRDFINCKSCERVCVANVLLCCWSISLVIPLSQAQTHAHRHWHINMGAQKWQL